MPGKKVGTVQGGEFAKRKLEKLEQAKIEYMKHPEGLNDKELAKLVSVSNRVAGIYRVELGAVKVAVGKYTYKPTADDLKFAALVVGCYADLEAVAEARADKRDAAHNEAEAEPG